MALLHRMLELLQRAPTQLRRNAPMSSLAPGTPNYTWTCPHDGLRGLYQRYPGRVVITEGPDGAAPICTVTQEHAAELGPILTRFGVTGILD